MGPPIDPPIVVFPPMFKVPQFTEPFSVQSPSVFTLVVASPLIEPLRTTFLRITVALGLNEMFWLMVPVSVRVSPRLILIALKDV